MTTSVHACLVTSVVYEPVAHQAPLSMGFSRQDHWSGLPFPLPGDLPDPAMEPAYLVTPAGRFFITEPPGSPSLHQSTLQVYNRENYIPLKENQRAEPDTAQLKAFRRTKATDAYLPTSPYVQKEHQEE